MNNEKYVNEMMEAERQAFELLEEFHQHPKYKNKKYDHSKFFTSSNEWEKDWNEFLTEKAQTGDCMNCKLEELDKQFDECECGSDCKECYPEEGQNE